MKTLRTHFIIKFRWTIYLIAFLWPLLLSGPQDHPALAYSVNLTIEAIEDAGLAPLQNAFARFVKEDNKQLLHTVDPQSASQWGSKTDVLTYASNYNNWDSAWLLKSAGNIWSNSDLIVGETLTGLSAGIYRITIVGGALSYDVFNWSQYYGKYYWQLYVQGFLQNGTPIGNSKMLGSIGDYLNPDDAFYDNRGKFWDLYLPGDGYLLFWVSDWNSIDNWGTLEVNIALVPLPGTLLFFGTGLLFLSARKTFKR